ncbi:MAG: lactate racemase domain-containing protein [Bacteroidales bacterium]|nr:lactate racemase domain-containing protein [Bacteroidales bacterium]
MLYYEKGSTELSLTDKQIKEAVTSSIEATGKSNKILVIPPDITRLHSGAGRITEMIWEEYRDKVSHVLPALGTHAPMTAKEKTRMFGTVPHDIIHDHDWRNDIVKLGEVPGAYLDSVTGGLISYEWPLQVNKLINKHSDSLIVSVGQVVPHEVMGMANHNKNIFIGCGGAEAINKSHYLSAVYGMEKIMGRVSNPVREVLNFGESAFAEHLNILYILTVVSTDNKGNPQTKGLFTGTGPECLIKAASLSSKLNITKLDKPPVKIVVYLDPDLYRSTWLGNKAIYRTRMAIADGGELVIIAPGVDKFGEDSEIDSLIRKYGYRTSGEIKNLVKQNKDLQDNLAVAAHLIHGSSEKRFEVTYCPGKLKEDEVSQAGYGFCSIEDALKKYDVENLKNGYNTLAGGEEIYYISNPGLGLWQTKRGKVNT